MTLLAAVVLVTTVIVHGATDAEMAAATAQGVTAMTDRATTHLKYAKKLVTAIDSGARSPPRSPTFTGFALLSA